MLLGNEANVNAANLVGATPLHFAAREGHTDVAAILLAAGANVHAAINYYPEMTNNDDYEQTPLYEAVERGHADIAWLLLDHGAKVSSLNPFVYNKMLVLLRSYPREVKLIPIPSN